MKTTPLRLRFALPAFLLATTAWGQATQYKVADAFLLGGPGRWDYITADAMNGRLYVTRTTHVQVVDTKTGKLVADIPGQTSNHGVAVAPDAGRGFISDDSGALFIFDLKSFAVLGKVPVPEDADGVLYDPATKKILTVCGEAGKLAMFDPNVNLNADGGKRVETIDLGGKPESFVVDRKGKAYVNLEDKDQVAAVDLLGKKVIARWDVKPGGVPVGLSIDPEGTRLFVGCRKPAKMIVLSTADGKVLGDLPIGRGCDACAFDDGRAFASCGDGTVTVVNAPKEGPITLSQTIKTAPGARTMTVDPSTHTLYLPTADFGEKSGDKRPPVKEGTFKVVVVKAG